MKVLAALLATAVLLGCAAEPTTRPEHEARHTTPRLQIKQSAPVQARTDLLIVGSVFWGRYVEDWADASRLGTRFPFQRLDELGSYDARIGGLECPVVNADHTSSAEQDRLLRFNCDPRFLRQAARWFTAFSLANNHAADRGRNGVAETRRHLRAAGIQPFGDPDPDRLDQVCRVVTVPAHVRRTDDSTTSGRLPIAFCGLNGVFEIPSQDAVRVVARYARHLPTVVLPHNGLEYVASPDSIKVDLAHRLVDAGADAVLADHPHWVQPAEAYHGRLIVHSLGNFIFDQQHDPERTRAASVHARLTVDDAHLDRWLALGAVCAQRRGDCLDAIRAEGLPRMRFRLRFGLVGSANPDRVTRPATNEELRGLRARLRWDVAMDDLRPPYGMLLGR